MPIMDMDQLHTDLLICADEEDAYLYHSRKIISKLRQVYNKENSWLFYREFPRKAYTDTEKYVNMQSFLINSLIF